MLSKKTESCFSCRVLTSSKIKLNITIALIVQGTCQKLAGRMGVENGGGS